MSASGISQPRAGCARSGASTATPLAARMRAMARAGSGAYLATCARPPAPSHSGPKAWSGDVITPAATIALAMCGLPTTCRFYHRHDLLPRVTGAPSPASRSIDRPGAGRPVLADLRALRGEISSSAGSNR